MSRRIPPARPRAGRRLALAMLLLGGVSALPAQALTDRATLLRWCTHGSAVAAGRCIGYLLAAEDALASHSLEGVRACLPPTVTLQEQHQSVLDWLNAHPDADARTALGLVARAYAARFPCPPATAD